MHHLSRQKFAISDHASRPIFWGPVAAFQEISILEEGLIFIDFIHVTASESPFSSLQVPLRVGRSVVTKKIQNIQEYIYMYIKHISIILKTGPFYIKKVLIYSKLARERKKDCRRCNYCSNSSVTVTGHRSPKFDERSQSSQVTKASDESIFRSTKMASESPQIAKNCPPAYFVLQKWLIYIYKNLK